MSADITVVLRAMKEGRCTGFTIWPTTSGGFQANCRNADGESWICNTSDSIWNAIAACAEDIERRQQKPQKRDLMSGVRRKLI